MKFRLVENNNTEFDVLWNEYLNSETEKLNNYLDKFGFEIEIVDDYYDEDTDVYNDSVGVFCQDIQDAASVFPIFINKNKIYELLSEDGLETDPQEIRWAIEGTLWHEAGHGIINYMYPDIEFDDEEETAEDFARYKNNSELIKTLQKYIDEI